MKLSFVIGICFLVVSSLSLSQGEWTWMWGPLNNTTASSAGQGVFSASNFPESRYAAVCWTDPNGKFWRFGGGGTNDLWQFDPVLNQWALMKGSLTTPNAAVYGTQGVAAPANNPGDAAFGHPAWADSQGNLWLYSVGFSDDLWKYTIATNQWTWVKGTAGASSAAVYGTQGVPGPTVSPGQCNETDCKWTDANDNLWLFNDFDGVLWKYDPLINQWTWIHGVPNGAPIYGTLGVPSPSNRPGQFSACPAVGALYCMWQDAANDLWMIVNRDGATVDMEIWRYNIASNQWTCMRIDPAGFGDPQVYGTQCIESPSAFPIPRTELRARWVDECDNLWIYGGGAFCIMSTDYGDLWRYSPATNNWTWIRGTNTAAVMGTQGVSSPANHPPPGVGQQHWEDESGFWLQGGQSINGSAIHHMWLYRPDSVTADFSHVSNCLTTDFTDLSSTGCNTIQSYAWDFGDPASGASNTSTIDNPTHTFSGNGTYQVTLVVANCTWDTDTIVQSITVNCGLNVTLTPDSICVGDCTDLLANVSGGTPPYTFQWDNGIANTSAGPITVCPTTTTTYSVIVTDDAGLSDTTNTTIYVFNPPVVDLGNDTILCVGASLLLSANNPGMNYEWQNGSTSSTQTVTTAGTYWVIVSNDGCERTDSIIVSFLGPQVDLGNDITLCEGESISLDAQNSGSNFEWQDASTNQIFLATTSGVYWVNVTDGTCSASDTVIISTQEIEASFTPTFSVGCSPLHVNFLDQSIVTNGTITSWEWSFGDGAVSDLQNPSHLYTNPGTYNVGLTVTSNLSCSDDTLVLAAVVGTPTAVAGFDHSPELVLPGDDIQFTNLSVNSTNWLWDFGDGTESTQEEPTHSYSQEGTFQVTLIAMNQNGCNDTVSYQITIESEFLLFAPNAFTPDGDAHNNEWKFSILGVDPNSFEVRIYDRWGELIWESFDPNSGWDGTYNGKLAQDGVYTWLIDCKAKSNGEQRSFVGHVSLMR